MKFFNLLTVYIFGFIIAGFIVSNIEQAQAQQTKSATDTRAAYAPFEDLFQVTPSDSTEFDPPIRGCIVEVSGDLVITPIKSAGDVTITVTAGQVIPALITHVKAATTAVIVCGR